VSEKGESEVIEKDDGAQERVKKSKIDRPRVRMSGQVTERDKRESVKAESKVEEYVIRKTDKREMKAQWRDRDKEGGERKREEREREREREREKEVVGRDESIEGPKYVRLLCRQESR